MYASVYFYTCVLCMLVYIFYTYVLCMLVYIFYIYVLCMLVYIFYTYVLCMLVHIIYIDTYHVPNVLCWTTACAVLLAPTSHCMYTVTATLCGTCTTLYYSVLLCTIPHMCCQYSETSVTRHLCNPTFSLIRPSREVQSPY